MDNLKIELQNKRSACAYLIGKFKGFDLSIINNVISYLNLAKENFDNGACKISGRSLDNGEVSNIIDKLNTQKESISSTISLLNSAVSKLDEQISKL